MTPEKQLEEWLIDIPLHDKESDECVPDFSCCKPNLEWTYERKLKFCKAYFNEDTDTIREMLVDSLVALYEYTMDEQYPFLKEILEAMYDDSSSNHRWKI